MDRRNELPMKQQQYDHYIHHEDNKQTQCRSQKLNQYPTIYLKLQIRKALCGGKEKRSHNSEC